MISSPKKKNYQKPPAVIRGVVFDLDGTLVDSAPILKIILNGLREERGLKCLSLEHYKNWSSVGGLKMIQNALQVDGPDAEQFLAEFRKRYSQIPTPQESIYGGVTLALETLRNKKIKMAICSNKPLNLCQKVLRDLDLLKYFETIVAGDTLEVKKPDPKMLFLATEGLGLSISDIVFVGDSIVDFETAKKAESKFMIYEGGYHEGVVFKNCDYHLRNFHDLVDLLLE